MYIMPHSERIESVGEVNNFLNSEGGYEMYKFDYKNLRDGDFPYTDLACERRRADTTLAGVEYKRESTCGGTWERIRISSPEGAYIFI